MLVQTTLFSVIIGLFAGCAGPPKHRPVYLDARFDPKQIDTITMLQPLDFRFDKSTKGDYVGILRSHGKRVFKRRKYGVQVNENTTLVAGVTEENLVEPSSEWVRNLGPSDANWVMVLSVEGVSRSISADGEGIAQVGGALFDKSAGTLVWRGVGKGFFRAGIMFGGLVDNDAVRMAVQNLALSLPRKNDNVSDYMSLSDPLVPLGYDKAKLPEKGMSKEEIASLFGDKPKVLDSEQGETWFYHENMGSAYVPFAANWYYPKVSVFHFDDDGALVKWLFTDSRISPRDKE